MTDADLPLLIHNGHIGPTIAGMAPYRCPQCGRIAYRLPPKPREEWPETYDPPRGSSAERVKQ